METKMVLTPEQQAILDGSKGETMAKVMKTMVNYGEIFGAEKMVPVTSEYGHLVLSFGLMFLGPVFDLYQELIDNGCLSGQKFTCDPRPYDPAVPQSPIAKAAAKVIYSKQGRYEKEMKQLGLLNDDSFTCTCYMPELGNVPKKGDVLSWAESSAVVYANSVLGARCNRNSGIIELFGSVCGYVPYFGFLTDEGRKATWVVKLETTKMPDAQILGSAIGMKVMEDVPYVYGLDKYLGNELNDAAKTYLKDFGAATASNGAVGLYHIDGLTPEAVELGDKLIADGAKEYIITDEELQRVKDNYPCIWKDPNATPEMCFLGCPHMSLEQLRDWTDKLEKGLAAAGNKKVSIPTVFTTSTPVLKEFKKLPEYKKLTNMGVVISYICPLMYMDNPLCASKPVITSSNKLRTYTTSRYYSNDEILEMLTKGLNKMKEFKGRAIVPGDATFEAVVTKNGFNTLASMQMMNLQPKTKCNDQSNPDLYKQIIEKKALCLPLTIGSTTGGMFLFAAVKEGKAPACLLFSQTIDSLAAAGAVLADVWAEDDMPVYDQLGDDFLNYVANGDKVTIKPDGTVIVEK